jgi:pilus assembly protein CpaE
MSLMENRETLHPTQRDSFSPGAPLSVMSICLDHDTRSVLKILVESIPLVRLRTQLEAYSLDEHDSPADYLGDPPADVCLIDFDRDRTSAANAAERIHGASPETAIFAVSSRVQPDLIIQAMRSGCSEYLAKPMDREQFLTAIARVGGRKKDRKDQYHAQVMTFVGAKGGCGVTSVLTQMGALLAKSYSRKSLVVDLHPDFGDAALYLGLTKARYHSFELLESTDRLDAELLHSFVIRHSSGLDLIPAPDGSDPARNILPGAMTRTFDFLSARYEFILVDLPPGLNDQNLELIRYSDQVYLITVPEVSALRNVVRQIDYLTRNDVRSDRIRVVLNRYHNKSMISDSQIEKAIRRRLFWKVPNQYPQVVKTIHSGDPMTNLSSSEVLRNLMGWAGAVGGKPASTEKKKESRGILGLWNR